MYLEPMANRYIEAAHPVTLPPETIARTLRGVLVQGRQTTIETLFESQEGIQRVFSEQDVAFLTPLLVKALSQAKPAQQVRFRITQFPRYQRGQLSISDTGGALVGSSEHPTYGPPLERTSGALFVYGLSLHLIVTEYRQKPQRPDNINMPNRRIPDVSNLDRVEILFAPKAALRPESYQEPGLLGEPHLTPIIIDYELLAKLPARQPQLAPPLNQPTAKEKATGPAVAAPSQPPTDKAPAKPTAESASANDIQSVKELMLKKDKEMEALKEEIRVIKKQLAEQDAQRQTDQPKDKKKKKLPAPAGDRAP